MRSLWILAISITIGEQAWALGQNTNYCQTIRQEATAPALCPYSSGIPAHRSRNLQAQNIVCSTNHTAEHLRSPQPFDFEAWSDALAGPDGLTLGIDTFGASAPAAELAEHFGLTAPSVTTKVAEWLGVG